MDKNKTSFYNVSAILIGLLIVLSVNNIVIPEVYAIQGEHHTRLKFHFSAPTLEIHGGSIVVRVNGTNLNLVSPNHPVIPLRVEVIEYQFGTKILDVKYSHSTPVVFNLTKPLVSGRKQGVDGYQTLGATREEPFFPEDWITYHTGGGLSYGEHKTFFVLRVHPIRYNCDKNQIYFISDITVDVTYKDGEKSFPTPPVYDLLIISPSSFVKPLQPLVDHKGSHGVKTKLVSVEEIKQQISNGRDLQEKIKYFIRKAIEEWGIKYVLLVGGLDGQKPVWNLPVRYSHVTPGEGDQEYVEASFISDLYYADIYDNEGRFSSWDSNNDNIFSSWNSTFREEVDLYPDVYLGRLPCRSIEEVRIIIRKIINYEEDTWGSTWFRNLLLVGGDSYDDNCGFNEGELICEEVAEVMPGFTPMKVYASQGDINGESVNSMFNKGCGFAYFVGHGNPASWNTHYPPEGKNWTTGYSIRDMVSLRNRGRYPIVVVGGCHNGEFDVSLSMFIKGFLKEGLHYFSTKPGSMGGFWYMEWVPNCWAWWLTSEIERGAIAAIANTGLGTHGVDDQDFNGVADYLEVLDGWLELRFFQLYGEEHQTVLGLNHGQTITEYMHRFLGNNDRMDVKMVQQWELFGDPSLKIGGYPMTIR